MSPRQPGDVPAKTQNEQIERTVDVARPSSPRHVLTMPDRRALLAAALGDTGSTAVVVVDETTMKEYVGTSSYPDVGQIWYIREADASGQWRGR